MLRKCFVFWLFCIARFQIANISLCVQYYVHNSIYCFGQGSLSLSLASVCASVCVCVL